jgi:hypothetical protein
MTNEVQKMTNDLTDRIVCSKFEGNIARNCARYFLGEIREFFPSENVIQHSHKREEIPPTPVAEDSGKSGWRGFLAFLGRQKNKPRFTYNSNCRFSYITYAQEDGESPFSFFEWITTKNGGWRKDSEVRGIESLVTAEAKEEGVTARLAIEAWYHTMPREFHYSRKELRAEAIEVQNSYFEANRIELPFGAALREAGKSIYVKRLAELRKISPTANCTGREIIAVRTDPHQLPEGASIETLQGILAEELCKKAYEATSATLNPAQIRYQVGEALKLFDPALRAQQIAEASRPDEKIAEPEKHYLELHTD